jgi:hypothetical protein
MTNLEFYNNLEKDITGEQWTKEELIREISSSPCVLCPALNICNQKEEIFTGTCHKHIAEYLEAEHPEENQP